MSSHRSASPRGEPSAWSRRRLRRRDAFKRNLVGPGRRESADLPPLRLRTPRDPVQPVSLGVTRPCRAALRLSGLTQPPPPCRPPGPRGRHPARGGSRPRAPPGPAGRGSVGPKAAGRRARRGGEVGDPGVVADEQGGAGERAPSRRSGRSRATRAPGHRPAGASAGPSTREKAGWRERRRSDLREAVTGQFLAEGAAPGVKGEEAGPADGEPPPAARRSLAGRRRGGGPSRRASPAARGPGRARRRREARPREARDRGRETLCPRAQGLDHGFAPRERDDDVGRVQRGAERPPPSLAGEHRGGSGPSQGSTSSTSPGPDRAGPRPAPRARAAHPVSRRAKRRHGAAQEEQVAERAGADEQDVRAGALRDVDAGGSHVAEEVRRAEDDDMGPAGAAGEADLVALLERVGDAVRRMDLFPAAAVDRRSRACARGSRRPAR